MDVVMIAHFITDFQPDGTSRFISISEELCKAHTVELITSSFDHIRKEMRVKQDYALKTKVTQLTEPPYRENVCLQRFISHREFGKQVKRYLEARKKPDLIYCAVPSLDCAYYAAKYARKHNIRFIIDVQDLWPEAFKLFFHIPVLQDIFFYPMKKMADYIYATADEILGVSQTYCNRAKQVNCKHKHCRPVFLGTKLSVFDRGKAEHSIPREDGKFRLAYCGTLGYSYDIKCVLDAMRILKEKGISNLTFWVMGSGQFEDSLRSYAEACGVDVVFWGRMPYEKMCGMLSSCDVCMNVITKDAAQSIINKHADYAASGLPVISTQNSAEYQALLREYECGFNCRSSSAQEVADAIRCLMNDPEKRKEMGARGRKMAEALFNRETSYQAICELVNAEPCVSPSSTEAHQAVLLELLQEFDRVCKKHQISYVLFAGTALGAVRHRGFIPWDDDLDVAMIRSEYERFLAVAPQELKESFYLQAEGSAHWPLHFSKLRKNNTACLEKYHPKDEKTHRGIYIDLFPIDNAAENPVLRKLQFYASKIVFAKSFYKRGYETNSLAKKIVMQACRLLPKKPFHALVVMKRAQNSQMVHSFFGGTSCYQKGVFPRNWFSETISSEFAGSFFLISASYDAMLTALYGDYRVLPSESERKCKQHAWLVDTQTDYTAYAEESRTATFDCYTRSIR